MLVETGNAECVVCGGSDSTSNAEVPLPKHVTAALANYSKSGVTGTSKQMGMPWTWLPSAPKIAER